jgi:hypothetical protein
VFILPFGDEWCRHFEWTAAAEPGVLLDRGDQTLMPPRDIKTGIDANKAGWNKGASRNAPQTCPARLCGLVASGSVYRLTYDNEKYLI